MNDCCQHFGELSQFINHGTLCLNTARLDHLKGMELPLGGTVYEPGCGVGLLTGYFEKYYDAVYSSDIQPQNVQSNIYLHPWRDSLCVNVEDAYRGGAYYDEEPFDMVACYGLLYHVADPARLIRRLSGITKGYLVIETCVNHEDNGKRNLQTEFEGPDQGLESVGCRPGRDWVMAELAKHFPYVYLARKQPDHDQFPLKWPTHPGHYTRAVFVGARKLMDIPALSPKLLTTHTRYSA